VHFTAFAIGLRCIISLNYEYVGIMKTCELMAGQTLYFYASAGSGIVLLEGRLPVTLSIAAVTSACDARLMRKSPTAGLFVWHSQQTCILPGGTCP